MNAKFGLFISLIANVIAFVHLFLLSVSAFVASSRRKLPI